MTDFGKRPGDMFKSVYDADEDGLVDDSEATAVHAASHQDGGSDKINVVNLSGELADKQDAGKIKGVIIDDAAKADQKALAYDLASNRIVYISIAICTLNVIDPLNLISNTITAGLSHAIT